MLLKRNEASNGGKGRSGRRRLPSAGVQLFNHARQVVAALNVSVLTLHYNLRQLVDDLGPQLQGTAQGISRSLGAPLE